MRAKAEAPPALTQSSTTLPPGPPSWRDVGWPAALVVAVVATLYADVLRIPFVNDDFVFLDRVRGAGFAALWSNVRTPFNWYRPWSRELHYWTLQHAFGSNSPAYHVVSLVLLVLVVAAYAYLVSRLAGRGAARFAACGWLVMSAWAIPVLWIAGVQELWLLLFACVFLALVLRRAPPWASALAYALALLSKETAATLPVIAAAFGLGVLDWRPREAWRQLGLLVVVTLAWAAIHPLIGGRLFSGAPASLATAHAMAPLAIATKTVASVVNLEGFARIDLRSPGTWAAGGALALLVGALIWIPAWREKSADVGPRLSRGTHAAVLVWCVAGWAPVLMPGIEWHAYYGLLGSAGAWVLLSLWIDAPLARIAIVALMSVLCAFQNLAPSTDWGTAYYLRRAALFLTHAERDLKAQLPTAPGGSRLYFVRVPYYVGFLTSGAPALRTWYDDSSISGGFWSDYRRRESVQPGRDYFFRFDSSAAFVPVIAGPESLPAALAGNPRWTRDHEALAAAFAQADDWDAAGGEYEKLLRVDPGNADYLFGGGLAALGVGDTTRAAALIAAAGRAPNASSEIRTAAERFARMR